VGLDPMPLDELLEQGPIEAARASIIDIFGAGLLAQFGLAQCALGCSDFGNLSSTFNVLCSQHR
jgi:hypothetical protein